MNLLPVTVYPDQSSSTNGLMVKCCDCGTLAIYYNAAAQGWKFDPDGKPFATYYCATCANRSQP